MTINISSSRHEAARAEVRNGDDVTRYLRVGTGKAVLLLRRSDEAHPLWPALMGELAAHFRVVVPEITDRSDFGTWLRAFLDGLGMLEASIVADDGVAIEALEFATLEGERVGRFVLLSSATREDAAPDPLSDGLMRELSIPLLVVRADVARAEAIATVTAFLGDTAPIPARIARAL